MTRMFKFTVTRLTIKVNYNHVHRVLKTPVLRVSESLPWFWSLNVSLARSFRQVRQPRQGADSEGQSHDQVVYLLINITDHQTNPNEQNSFFKRNQVWQIEMSGTLHFLCNSCTVVPVSLYHGRRHHRVPLNDGWCTDDWQCDLARESSSVINSWWKTRTCDIEQALKSEL